MSPAPDRRRLLATLVTLTALQAAGCALRRPMAGDSGVPRIAPFSGAGPHDGVPAGWEAYVLRRDIPATDYRVATFDGRQVLHAHASGGSSGLRCPVNADPLRTPWLRWAWRTDEVPAGACVADKDADDSPARVVVAFDGDHGLLSQRDRAFFDLVELLTGHRLPYATLMYVWDARLPVGTVVPYARSSRIRYLVVDSGPGRVGRWVAHERDLREDFRMAFGEAPGRVTSVGVLTDSDDLHLPISSWYGDIELDDV